MGDHQLKKATKLLMADVQQKSKKHHAALAPKPVLLLTEILQYVL